MSLSNTKGRMVGQTADFRARKLQILRRNEGFRRIKTGVRVTLRLYFGTTSAKATASNMSTAAQRQKRLLPLFQYVNSTTKIKFGMRVQREPKLAGLGILGQGATFSCFHEDHLDEARQLYEVLINAESFDEFLDLCHQCREYVNRGLFIYAVSVAILNRSDCRGVHLPPIQEVCPYQFVPMETLWNAYKEVALHPLDEEMIVDMQDTGNVLDPEFNLAYYREDVAINAHHWHWHLVYPATWRPEVTGKIKDRKGELFYYMHQQMCARYDCERLSNDMPQMIPFHNFDEPLEGYSSHLHSSTNVHPILARCEGKTLQDRPDCAVHDLDRWRERILDAIDRGVAVDPHGAKTPLDENHGIDILGDIIEASYDSVNRPFYGSLHNWGHVMIASIMDPDGRYKLNPGAMDDSSVALRDPIFYRWHRFIDDLFQEHKKKLSPYTKEQLSFRGVSVKSLTVQAHVNNTIETFLGHDLLDLTHFYHFGRSGAVKIRFKQLDHEPFSYKIVVNNNGTKTRHAKVRIFLGPKYDHLGNEIKICDLRRLMIEMDNFKIELKPGENTLVRESIESSVTIKNPKKLEELIRGEGAGEHMEEYCSCGWPHHLLVPKGNDHGMEYHLFAIFTDFLEDMVNDHGRTSECLDAVSYCGAKDQLFPDKRAMGFPFDREIMAFSFKEWLQPNMFDIPVTVKHVETDHSS